MNLISDKKYSRIFTNSRFLSKFSLLLFGLFIGACTITPERLTISDLNKSANEDRKLMFGNEKHITGSLSLEEAIARALKYNLDHRARAMEKALAFNQLELENYRLLPTLTANAGYADRSKFSATNSKERGDGEGPASGYSHSADRTAFTGDLALSWNILDFGVSYFKTEGSIGIKVGNR